MAVASLTRLRRPANHYGARSGYCPPPVMQTDRPPPLSNPSCHYWADDAGER